MSSPHCHRAYLAFQTSPRHVLFSFLRPLCTSSTPISIPLLATPPPRPLPTSFKFHSIPLYWEHLRRDNLPLTPPFQAPTTPSPRTRSKLPTAARRRQKSPSQAEMIGGPGGPKRSTRAIATWGRRGGGNNAGYWVSPCLYVITYIIFPPRWVKRVKPQSRRWRQK